MNILGIDYGAKKIGLALLNTETEIIFPLDIVTNTYDVIGKLKQIIENYQVKEIVIGKPPSKNIFKRQQLFVKSLTEFFNIPIYTVGEGNTTQSVKGDLKHRKQISLQNIKKSKQKLDVFSAIEILEAWKNSVK